MKTIFVSEYLCSGALVDQELPPSLLQEGRAMLFAFCQDLIRSGKFHVLTTLDQRIDIDQFLTHSDRSRCSVIAIDQVDQEESAFQKLALEADVSFIIAPELDEVLQQRVTWLESLQLSALPGDALSVELTSDKLTFAEFCFERSIPTPQTKLYSQEHSRSDELESMIRRSGCVVKPRWGAGATDTYLIKSMQEWGQFENSCSQSQTNEMIVQPYIEGRKVSLAALVSLNAQPVIWTPLGLQLFDSIRYLGGLIPFQDPRAGQVQDLAQKVLEELPRLKGWIGFDFILPNDLQEAPVLLEVNPRLTTSYLGYRQLATFNLAEFLIDTVEVEKTWRDREVRFSPVDH